MTTTVLLPVPFKPTTCQTSSMRYSLRGIRKLPKSTGLPSLITGPPRNAHVAWSQPEDHCHAPLTRYPPSTTVPAPIGAYDDETRTVGSLPPHLVLCLLVEQGEVPVVHTDDGRHPPGGTTRAGEAPDRLVEDGGGVALHATPLLGLEQLEEADLVEFVHGLIGQAPQFFGGLSALGDPRQQIVDAG